MLPVAPLSDDSDGSEGKLDVPEPSDFSEGKLELAPAEPELQLGMGSFQLLVDAARGVLELPPSAPKPLVG